MTSHHSPQRTIHFIRHGATELNLRGLRCGGDLDVELVDLGLRQAYQAGMRIQGMDLGINVIVASGLKRAHQTASIISGLLGHVPVVVEPLLNERLLGEWNRRPRTETESLLARNETPPGGESEAAFLRRVSHALEKLLPLLPRTPLVVSSSGVGRAFNTLLGGPGRLRLSSGELTRFIVSSNRYRDANGYEPVSIIEALPEEA